MDAQRPRVGVGVIVLRNGKVLIMKRTGSHAPYYSIPGGHLELGEHFEQAAIRELHEECGILIENPHVIGVVNNLETYKEEGRHSISIILLAEEFTGDPVLCEPEKCSELVWVDPLHLPEPHFEASRNGISLYLNKIFYAVLPKEVE